MGRDGRLHVVALRRPQTRQLRPAAHVVAASAAGAALAQRGLRRGQRRGSQLGDAARSVGKRVRLKNILMRFSLLRCATREQCVYGRLRFACLARILQYPKTAFTELTHNILPHGPMILSPTRKRDARHARLAMKLHQSSLTSKFCRRVASAATSDW